MIEVWRPVVGYEGLYEISNLGNLVRVSTYGKNPRSCRKPRAKSLKKGYRTFHMCANGVSKYRYAHVMVWEAFEGPVPDGLELNHKDRDRDHPALTNLEVLTHAGNIQHSFRTFPREKFNVVPKPGSTNGCAKLTEESVIEIRKLRAAGERRIDIARRFGVSDTAIGLITSRKKWRHI
jgi:HNH endonuclease/NUMOD4 motif